MIADLSLGAEAFEPYPATSLIGGPTFGETIEAAGSKYTVNAINDGYSGGFFGPDPGNRIVALDITQEGVEAEDPCNPFYFYLQTTDDFVYQCSNLGAPDPSFDSGALGVGQKVRSWVSREVLEDAVVAAVWAETEIFGLSAVIAVP